MVEAQAAKATVDLRAVPATEDGRNAESWLISRRGRRAGPGAYAGPPDRPRPLRVFQRRQRGRGAGRQRGARAVADPRRGQRRPAPLPGLRTGRRQPVGSRHPAREGTGQPSPSPRSGTTAKWTSTRSPRRSSRSSAWRGSGDRTSAGSSSAPYGLAAGRHRRLAPGAHRGREGPGPVQRRRHDRQQAHPEHHGCRGRLGRIRRPDRQRPDAGQGLAVDLGVPTAGASETELAPRILAALRVLADRRGRRGAASSTPSVQAIRDLDGLAGNARSWQSPPRRDALKPRRGSAAPARVSLAPAVGTPRSNGEALDRIRFVGGRTTDSAQ